MSRSQTSTEYLVLAAVVIVIAVIVVSVLGSIPSIGSGASSRSNAAELRTAEIATEGFSIGTESLLLKLRNNKHFKIQIDAIIVNGTACDATFPVELNVGEKKDVTCSNINDSNGGTTFEYTYSMNWTNLVTSASFSTELPNLIGVVSGSSSGTVESPPSSPSLGVTCDALDSTGLNGGLFYNGSGSEASPYTVCNCTMLQNMSVNLTYGFNYTQAADIDCDVSPFDTGLGFNPIGTSGDPFKGTFNGSSFNISNLFINRPATSYVGLFSYTNNNAAVIINAHLLGVNITGANSVGGLVGYKGNGAGSASISNSYVKGIVNGTNNVGGLIGLISVTSQDTGIMDNLSTQATVTGANYVGGLIGSTNSGNLTNSFSASNISGTNSIGGLVGFANTAYQVTIDNSYSTGTVTGTTKVGGIVGRGGPNINNSNVQGNVVGSGAEVGGFIGYTLKDLSITNSYVSGNVSGTSSIGGLIGQAYSSYQVTVDASYSSGNVSGTSSVGGLVGTGKASFNDSSSRGIIEGTGTNVGGLLGYSAGNMNITNSYSSAIITGTSYVGGLVGQSSSSYQITIDNSYLSGTVTGTNSVGGLAGKAKIDFNNSYATGEVIGSSSNVGGFVGYGLEISILNSYATSDVTGTTAVGGLVGTGGSNYILTIDNSYSSGYITGTNSVGGIVGAGINYLTNSNFSGTTYSSSSGSSIGGFVGQELYYESYYTDLNFTGTVEADSMYYVGGLVGHSSSNYATNITNAYIEGSVTGSYYIGGLVGYKQNAKVINISDSDVTGTIVCGATSYCGGIIGDASTHEFNTVTWTNGSATAYTCVGDASSNITGTNPSGCTAS